MSLGLTNPPSRSPGQATRRPRTGNYVSIGAVTLAALAAVGGTAVWIFSRSGSVQSSAVTASTASGRLIEAIREDLEVTIDDDGELQAVDNIELMSRVEGRATITDIAKEGVLVKAGTTVIELDSSTIRQNIDDASIELQKSEAAVANAQSQLKIQESNNSAELEGATVALTLAEIELKKYVEGTYPQSLESAKAKLQIARTKLTQTSDDLAQSRNLFQRGFVTATEVKNRENAQAQAAIDLRASENDLNVLTEYTYRADIASKNNAVVQAKNKLDRVKTQNESLIMQRQADLAAAQQQFETRQRRMEYLNQQLEATKITAPSDGLVVYVQPDGNGQGGPIQQGAEVRERQVIVRLPDTTRMKAVVRVSEGQIVPIRTGQRALVRVTSLNEAVPATVRRVSLMPDSSRGWWSSGSTKEYPVDIDLDHTPEGLKPGASVTVAIFVNRAPQVLTVPVQSLYVQGKQTFVFVAEGEQIAPRQVTVGLVGKKSVEIKTGLKDGERVLQLQAGEGQALLKRAGIELTQIAPEKAPEGGPPAGATPADNGPPRGPGQRPGGVRPEGTGGSSDTPRPRRNRNDGAPGGAAPTTSSGR
jgi:HlyD family secretion protein